MENREVFKISLELEGKRKNIFGKVVYETQYTFLGYEYCFEHQIQKRHPISEITDTWFYTDNYCSMAKLEVIKKTILYTSVKLPINYLANNLSADDFLQYCRDNNITSITIGI